MSCGVDSAFWANTRRHLIRYGRAGVMLGIEGDAPDLHALSQALSVELPLAAWLTPGQTAEGRHAGGFFYLPRAGDGVAAAPPRRLEVAVRADAWPDSGLHALRRSFDSDEAGNAPGRGLLLGIEIVQARERATLGLRMDVVALHGRHGVQASEAEAELGTRLLKQAVAHGA
ncbi:hypothetical protein [Variovorax sp. DAIF25]|jgi:4-aminobutyrate aminotransferase-like enzyme|uniref:hypothetical protein n=1 Tax=Variovorax sp. DAIF25 TaxID=3080983 RepID=UPI003D6C31E2